MVIIQSGSAATGWKQIDGSWFYFDETNGNMKTGWQEIGGVLYYLKKNGDGVNWSGPEGSMLYSTKVWIGNKEYEFDSNGHCLNP